MKQLILLGLLLFNASAFAHTQKELELVRENAFKCDDDEIKLKGLWGDVVGAWNANGVGTFKRESMVALDCDRLLESLYRAGAPETLTFLLQVKSFKNPVKWSALLGVETKLNANDKDTVRAYLTNYGVIVDSPEAKVNQMLADYDLKKQSGLIGPTFLNTLKSLVTAQNVDLTAKTASGGMIIETLIELEHKHPRLGMKEVLEAALEGKPSSFFHKGTAAVSIAARLVVYGLGELVPHDFDWAWVGNSRAAQNFVAGYLSADEAMAIRIFNSFNARGNAIVLAVAKEFPIIQTGLCRMVVGKMISAKSILLNNLLMTLYKNGDCHEFDGVVAAGDGFQIAPDVIYLGTGVNIDLLKNYPREHSDLVKTLVGLQRSMPYDLSARIEKSFENCSFDSSTDDLLTEEKVHSHLLEKAILSKCEVAVKALAKKVSLYDAEWVFKYGLENKQVDKKMISAVLSVLAAKGVFMSDYMIEPMKRRFGKDIFRSVAVAKRVSDPKAREKLLQAEDSDSDEIVQLKWKEIIIELQRSKLTDAQQTLVDKLRLAQYPEDTSSALREALIDWQLKVRFAKSAADELRASIAQFKPGSDLLGTLVNAKSVLDQTRTKGGRPAIYNERSTSVLDPIISGRAQCNAGTDFMLLHSGKAGLEDANEVQVVVFQPKHILPGVIRKSAPGTVETIESTVNKAGRGKVDAVSGQWPKDRKVILADDYLVAKILGSAMKDRAKNAEDLSARAEKILGIKQGEITPKKPTGDNETSSSYTDALNESSFGFGDAQIPSGDVEIQDMDVVPQNLSGVEATRLGMARESSGSRLSRFAPTKPQEGAIRQFKRVPEEHELVTIPSHQNYPIEHILASIEREFIFGKYRRSYNIGNVQTIRSRIDTILGQLTEEQKRMLESRVAQSTGATVDIIILKQDSLKEGIESPQQKQIPQSRELVQAYLEKLKAGDKIVNGFAGLLRKNTDRYEDSSYYPDCSIETAAIPGRFYRSIKPCDETENQSMIDWYHHKFQQNRKTSYHENVVKFRVLLQDISVNVPYALDILMDVQDDGDFTVIFEPIGNLELFQGQNREKSNLDL